MPIVLHYATLTQLGNEFRQRYLDSSGVQTWRLAKWLMDRIDDGTVTDAQVRNFFNLSVPQYNTLKTKMLDFRTKYEDLQGAAGE